MACVSFTYTVAKWWYQVSCSNEVSQFKLFSGYWICCDSLVSCNFTTVHVWTHMCTNSHAYTHTYTTIHTCMYTHTIHTSMYVYVFIVHTYMDTQLNIFTSSNMASSHNTHISITLLLHNYVSDEIIWWSKINHVLMILQEWAFQ